MTLLLVALTAALHAAPAEPYAPAVPSLTPLQQETLARVAADEFCGCDSALTLAACLKSRPQCTLARTIEQVLARAIASGASPQALAGFASQALLGPLCASVQKLDVPGAGRLGPPGAPLTVVEFADFRCTHCREAMPAVHAAIKRFGKSVQLLYVPVSLADHPHSTAAAEAVLVAGKQGKFWPMQAALFGHTEGTYDAATLRRIAKQAGLHMAAYEADMAKHTMLPTLRALRQQADAAGITGTPAFFVNGRSFAPIPPVYSLDDRLTMEQQRNQAACK